MSYLSCVIIILEVVLLILKISCKSLQLIRLICLHLSTINTFINKIKFKIMAIINQGILAGLSGKIGSVVGSSWKGIPVLRTKALSVANPRTSGQIGQRNAFTQAVQVATILLSDLIIPLWNRFSVKMSGYNSFVSKNIDVFKGGFSANYANFCISQGKMAATPITSCTISSTTGNITINWTDDSGSGYKLASDKPHFVVMDVAGNVVGFDLGAVRRSDGSLSYVLQNKPHSGVEVYVYLCFSRVDGTIVSNTSYILITPA
jgi:hypothetical protein